MITAKWEKGKQNGCQTMKSRHISIQEKEGNFNVANKWDKFRDRVMDLNGGGGGTSCHKGHGRRVRCRQSTMVQTLGTR